VLAAKFSAAIVLNKRCLLGGFPFYSRALPSSPRLANAVKTIKSSKKKYGYLVVLTNTLAIRLFIRV